MTDRHVLQSLVDLTQAIFRAQAASVALLDSDGGIVFEAVSGRGEWMVGVRFAQGEGITGQIAATGEGVWVPDASADPRFARGFAELTGYVPEAMLGAPLVVDGTVRGVISVLDPGELRDGVETLTTFASIAVLAL